MTDLRPSRHRTWMDMAHVVAQRSTCLRLNVGAVIVKDRRVLGLGYNGAPTGEPHCDQDNCLTQPSCKRTIHAEANAISRVPEQFTGLDLYVTHSPCSTCFSDIWTERRIDRIFFGAEFRDTSHLTGSLFELEVYRVLPSGSIIDWHTKEVANVWS